MATEQQQAEIKRYVNAYREAIPDNVLATFFDMPRHERKKIKHDAEYHARTVSPQAQSWYDAVRVAMGKNKAGKGPDWSKIRADESALLGNSVMTQVGQIFFQAKRNATAPEQSAPVLPDATAILSQPRASRQTNADKYLHLASNFPMLPPDAIVAPLLEITVNQVMHIRRDLHDKGWEFTPAELPEWAYRGKETWWRVAKRPPTEAEIKAQLSSKLSAKIDALSAVELQTLIELLG